MELDLQDPACGPFPEPNELCPHIPRGVRGSVVGWGTMLQAGSILWNPKIHYHVHNIPPLLPILSQINPFHITPSCLSQIHFIIHPHSSWSS
jgi:hypothetical protein